MSESKIEPALVELPGFVDMHAHTCGFDQSDKEDLASCSQAAIVGGITTICAMPNYEPEMEVRPYNLVNMRNLHERARGRAYCDVGMWAASQPKYNNVGDLAALQPHAIGVKFYMEPTQGNEELFSPRDFEPAAREWHRVAEPTQPIAAHTEDETIEEAIAMIAGEIGHPLHIPHVNNRFVLDAIIKAKNEGWPVTCGVTPHHLFMTEDDVARLGWFARMKPRLVSQEDQNYLWANLKAIDVFETDHAPHTREEKERANLENPEGKTGKDDVKSFGVPGLEAMLPLLLRALEERRLSPQQLLSKAFIQPRAILGLPTIKSKTTVQISMEQYEFSQEDVRSKCGWSPYLGRMVTGRVMEVKLRDQIIYRRGEGHNGFLLDHGTGQVLNPV